MTDTKEAIKTLFRTLTTSNPGLHKLNIGRDVTMINVIRDIGKNLTTIDGMLGFIRFVSFCLLAVTYSELFV